MLLAAVSIVVDVVYILSLLSASLKYLLSQCQFAISALIYRKLMASREFSKYLATQKNVIVVDGESYYLISIPEHLIIFFCSLFPPLTIPVDYGTIGCSPGQLVDDIYIKHGLHRTIVHYENAFAYL